MAKIITKRINHNFVERHFEICIISYSFFEVFCGAEGTIKYHIKNTEDGTEATLTSCCSDRYGWNWYANQPNIHILEDVIQKDIENIV